MGTYRGFTTRVHTKSSNSNSQLENIQTCKVHLSLYTHKLAREDGNVYRGPKTLRHSLQHVFARFFFLGCRQPMGILYPHRHGISTKWFQHMVRVFSRVKKNLLKYVYDQRDTLMYKPVTISTHHITSLFPVYQ